MLAAPRSGAAETELLSTNRPTTLLEELLSAARGVAAVVAGDRRAARFFDFSPRGLAGSFIAFLIAMLLNAYMPDFGGDPADAALPATRLLTIGAFLFAAQVAFTALVLRQINRFDGFVPYLVADNWTTFFVVALSTLLALLGMPNEFIVLAGGLFALIVEINIARLILTLRPWQIAMFLVAQVVGVLIGLILVWTLFPMPDAALPGA